MDCITPSNQNPIPNGESIDIYQLLEKLRIKNFDQLYGGELETMKCVEFDQASWEETSQILRKGDSKWIKKQMANTDPRKVNPKAHSKYNLSKNCEIKNDV
jgi:hypothetical protein